MPEALEPHPTPGAEVADFTGNFHEGNDPQSFELIEVVKPGWIGRILEGYSRDLHKKC